MSVYNELTEDAIDDHGIIADGTAKVVTVTQQEQQATFHPSHNRESLMERTRKWREQNGQEPEEQRAAGSLDASTIDLSEVHQRLDKLENLILLLANRDSAAPDSTVLNQIVDAQIRQNRVLETLQNNYARLEEQIQNQNNDIARSILKEFSNQRKEIGNLGSYVQSLAKSGTPDLSSTIAPETVESFQRYLKWILITIIAVIVVLSVIVHRLRKDVKHSKLL